MLEKEDMRGEAGLARGWILRINDAIIRLKFEQRAEKRAKVIDMIEATDWLIGTKYLDLNEGLPAFEDVINATLAEVPPPDVALDYADEVVCEVCQGQGNSPVPDGLAQQQPCPVCGGDGLTSLHTDLKCEAYLRMIFKPHVGNVKGVIEDIEWDDLSWGIGWGKVVWRRDRKKTARESLDAPDAVDQTDRARAELEGVEERDDDNHIIHIRQHEADIETMVVEDERRLGLSEHINQHKMAAEETVFQYPELQRVLPDEMVYDPFARRWKDVTWYAELATERVEDLKRIPGIKNVTEENLPRNQTSEADEASLEDLPYDEARGDVVKIHDRNKGQWIILPLRQPEPPFDGNVLPLLVTDWPYPNNVYIPIVTRKNGRKSLHGISTLVLCKNTLQEIAKVNRSIRRHVEKHSQYKRAWKRGVLDDKAKKQLADPDKTIVELPQTAGMGEEIKPPPIPSTLLERLELLMSRLKALLGSSNESTGADNPHEVTATEVSIRAVRYDSKIIRRQGKMGDFLSLVGMFFLEDYRQFGDKPMPLMIETAAGRQIQEFSPADVPTHMRVSFDVTATTGEAKASRMQQQQNFLMQLLASGVGDPRKVLEEWGRSIDIRDPSRLFFDQQPAMMPDQQGQQGQQGQMPAIPSDKSAPPMGQIGQPQLKLAGGGAA